MNRSTLFTVIVFLFALILGDIFVYGNLESHQIDLAAYIAASRRLLAGKSLYAEIYDLDVSRVIFGENQIKAGAFSLYFRYPPLLAALLSPIAYWPWQQIKALWLVVSFTALMGSVWILVDLLGGVRSWSTLSRPARAFIVLLSLFIFDPLSLVFAEGQVDIIVLFLLLGFIKLHLKNEKVGYFAGGLLAFAASLKIVPILLLVFSLRQKRWKELFGFGLFVLIWFLCLEVLFSRPSASFDFFHNYKNLLNNALESKLLGNFALDSVLYVWKASSLSGALALLIKVLALVSAWALAWPSESAERQVESLLKVLALLVFLSSTMFAHHLVWVLPLLLSQLLNIKSSNSSWPQASFSGFLVLLLIGKAYLLYMTAYHLGRNSGDYWVTPVVLMLNIVLVIVLRKKFPLKA